jgi:hypothetical protein
VTTLAIPSAAFLSAAEGQRPEPPWQRKIDQRAPYVIAGRGEAHACSSEGTDGKTGARMKAPDVASDHPTQGAFE